MSALHMSWAVFHSFYFVILNFCEHWFCFSVLGVFSLHTVHCLRIERYFDCCLCLKVKIKKLASVF
jgi:hypothetical protein